MLPTLPFSVRAVMFPSFTFMGENSWLSLDSMPIMSIMSLILMSIIQFAFNLHVLHLFHLPWVRHRTNHIFTESSLFFFEAHHALCSQGWKKLFNELDQLFTLPRSLSNESLCWSQQYRIDTISLEAYPQDFVILEVNYLSIAEKVSNQILCW